MTESGIDRDGMAVRLLRTRDELVAAAGNDPYVRYSAPATADVRGWQAGAGVAWFSHAPHRAGAGWLNVVGSPSAVATLVSVGVAESGGTVTGITVPAAALESLPERLRPPGYNLWDWFWTSTPPPEQRGEDAVTWASQGEDTAIAELLDGHSPRHSARPGEAAVRRFCVIRDAAGEVVACAAHVEYVAGVPHLASIATRTDLRGQGLAGAITAWLTRRLLEEGGSVVTLGMYADNEVARRLYRRLGYTDSHHWASGRLPEGQPDGVDRPVEGRSDPVG